MVLEYLPTFSQHKPPSFVGKDTSTMPYIGYMEHMGYGMKYSSPWIQTLSKRRDGVPQAWHGPPLDVTGAVEAPGIPFCLAQLEAAIMKLHPNKSVAVPFLPAVVWQGAPRELAVLLMGCLQKWWTLSPPVIPQCWRDQGNHALILISCVPSR